MRRAFFLFLLLLLAPFPALAQSRGGVQPLDRLLPEIRRTHPGKFYDADGPTLGPDGDAHYHLKWMTPDGRIEWLDTDARTGRVMGTLPDRGGFEGRPGAFGPPPPEPYGRGYYRFGPAPDFGRGNFGRGGYDRREGRGGWSGRGGGRGWNR